jgi:hypothetical protein
MDPADKNLVGRRVRWSVYGREYTGKIVNVILEDTDVGYKKGDWIVEPDRNVFRGQTVIVIGDESKLEKETK